MSEKEKTPAERHVFKLGDDAILMIRELIQLSILTGTNIVDHFRAMQLEPVEGKEMYLTVTPEYLDGYNAMVLKLNEEAVEMQKQAQAKIITSDSEQSSSEDKN